MVRHRKDDAVPKNQTVENDVAQDDIVAVTFGFPNLAETLKQANGRPSPNELHEAMANTKSIIANGIVIKPNYQIMGLSALLFCEMTKMAYRANNVQDACMVHVSGPGNRMANDMSVVDAQPVHWHRLYARELS